MDVSIILLLAILVVMIIIAWQIRKPAGDGLGVSPDYKKLQEDINQIAFDIHLLTETLGKFSDRSYKNKGGANPEMMERAAGDPLSGPIPPKGGPHYIQVVVIDQDFT